MNASSEFYDGETGRNLNIDQTGVRGQFAEIHTDGGRPFKVLLTDLVEFLEKTRQIQLDSG
jgi:hypothetical protein